MIQPLTGAPMKNPCPPVNPSTHGQGVKWSNPSASRTAWGFRDRIASQLAGRGAYDSCSRGNTGRGRRVVGRPGRIRRRQATTHSSNTEIEPSRNPSNNNSNSGIAPGLTTGIYAGTARVQPKYWQKHLAGHSETAACERRDIARNAGFIRPGTAFNTQRPHKCGVAAAQAPATTSFPPASRDTFGCPRSGGAR
jgi:hypothetical protein